MLFTSGGRDQLKLRLKLRIPSRDKRPANPPPPHLGCFYLFVSQFARENSSSHGTPRWKRNLCRSSKAPVVKPFLPTLFTLFTLFHPPPLQPLFPTTASPSLNLSNCTKSKLEIGSLTRRNFECRYQKKLPFHSPNVKGVWKRRFRHKPLCFINSSRLYRFTAAGDALIVDAFPLLQLANTSSNH